jgi:hypothetical protein
MDQQTLINVLLGIAGFCIAWWVNKIWGMVTAMQQDISNLHVKLAENYMPRSETNITLSRIFDKLDEIQSEIRGSK